MINPSFSSLPDVDSELFEQVTDDELRNFADLIYKRTGIRISPHKKLLLSNRLRRRLELDPGNVELRRQLGETLLDQGDRDAGGGGVQFHGYLPGVRQKQGGPLRMSRPAGGAQ